MSTEKHQIDENKKVIDVKSFAAFVGVYRLLAMTSVCIETTIKVMLSNVSPWKPVED